MLVCVLYYYTHTKSSHKYNSFYTVIYIICRCVECTMMFLNALYSCSYAFLCNSSQDLKIIYSTMGAYIYVRTRFTCISWFTTGRICLHYYVFGTAVCGMINYIWAALVRLSSPIMRESASVEILPPDVTTFGWLGVILHCIKNSQSPCWMLCKICAFAFALVVRFCRLYKHHMQVMLLYPI